jgi:hypothetical protein
VTGEREEEMCCCDYLRSSLNTTMTRRKNVMTLSKKMFCFNTKIAFDFDPAYLLKPHLVLDLFTTFSMLLFFVSHSPL